MKTRSPFILELENVDAVQCFSAVADMPYSLWLDSADTNHKNARYSFIMSHPRETIEAKNGEVLHTMVGEQQKVEENPFTFLQNRLKTLGRNVQTVKGLSPFQGGAAGYFGYDLGRDLEDIPSYAQDNPDMPDMAIGIYDQVVAFDHEQKRKWIITFADDYNNARKKQNHLVSLIKDTPVRVTYNSHTLDWRTNFSKAGYIKTIQQVIDYIYAGDIFQANISQRFDAQLPQQFDRFAHYLHLREINPAPFASFFNLGHIALSSCSPERFLFCKNGYVETRPIKGTRPRTGTNNLDAQYKHALLNSEKDKSENIMIVDLLRNDLSKVCTQKSVNVSGLCELEEFGNVFHLVSTVKGKLKANETALDLLAASFPGGSITGAPKIRAMEIIDELEPVRRGPYCGAMGYIGFDGTMDTNILIRTLVYDGNTVSLQSGGGIVADSNPEEEYQETFTKVNAILHSFENVNNAQKRWA